MKNKSELFKQTFEEIFPVIKTCLDLVKHLDETNKEKSSHFLIEFFNTDTSEIEIKTISSNDDVTIISFRAIYEFSVDFYYEVVIGIGMYAKGDIGSYFFTVEKCLAIMKYNDDLSIYDIEFLINQINKMDL